MLIVQNHTSIGDFSVFKKLHRRWLLTVATLLLAPTFVTAQALDAWPDKPVKLIVPFPSGGPTDTVARIISSGLQTIWKQPVVLDYKPGAGTMLGTGLVAKSPADGYTLGMAITALTITPSLQANMSYDTKKDLVGVSLSVFKWFETDGLIS